MSLSPEANEFLYAAVEFVAYASRFADRLPPQPNELARQLRDEALAVPLKIAAGAGAADSERRSELFWAARRSAVACAAILDECRELALVDSDDLEQGRDVLRRVLSLLGRAAASERVAFVAEEARRRAARVA